MREHYVEDIAAGERHSFFVTKNKNSDETEVFACGYNNFGELAIGRSMHLTDLTKVETLSNFKIQTNKNKSENVRVDQIECGNHHCMALFNLGSIMEWGNNEKGQLGKFLIDSNLQEIEEELSR